MKPVLAKTLFAAVLLTNLSTFAQGLNAQLSKENGSLSKGGVATGGGDLCEDRIQSIRDDLKKWIIEGGSQTLKLPAGFTAQKYKDEMLEKIQTTSVRCVGNGDAGYPVTVEGSAKVCRFDRSGSANLITCDYKKFQDMSESNQYVLVHHEYAGLADVERPNGSDSDYSVSNQISGSLVDQVVKKLAVRTASYGFKDIPAERVTDYAKALSLAIQKNNNNYKCEVPGRYYPGAIDYEGANGASLEAKRAKMKESGGTLTFIFDQTKRDLDSRKYVNTIVSNGTDVTSVVTEALVIKDVNVGTIENPKIVKQWLADGSYVCVLRKK